MKNVLSTTMKKLLFLTLAFTISFSGMVLLKMPNIAYAFDGSGGAIFLLKYTSNYINKVTKPSISQNKIDISEYMEGFGHLELFKRTTVEDSYANDLKGKLIFKNDITTKYNFKKIYYPILGNEVSITTREGTNFYHDKTTKINEVYNSPNDTRIGDLEIGRTYAETDFGGQTFFVSKKQDFDILYIALSDSDSNPNKIYSIRIPISVWELKFIFNEEKSQFVLENTGRKIPCKDISISQGEKRSPANAQEGKDGLCYVVVLLSKGKKAEDLHIITDKVIYTANITPDVWNVDYWGFSYGQITSSTEKPGKPAVPKATPTPLPKPSPIPESLINNLTFGSRGERVKTLQNQLIKEGYLRADDSTGYYGPLTLSAVNRYKAFLASSAVTNDSSVIIPKATPTSTPIPTYSPNPTITPSRTPVYTPAPTYSPSPSITSSPTYTAIPIITATPPSPSSVVTSTPTPTTYVAPVSTPTTSPTPTTTASPTPTSTPSPKYNYPTSTYSPTPSTTPRPTSSPVSSVFGEYQTASVWTLMLKFLRFTF